MLVIVVNGLYWPFSTSALIVRKSFVGYQSSSHLYNRHESKQEQHFGHVMHSFGHTIHSTTWESSGNEMQMWK